MVAADDDRRQLGLERLQPDRAGRLRNASDRDLLRPGDAVRDAELGVRLTDDELVVRRPDDELELPRARRPSRSR